MKRNFNKLDKDIIHISYHERSPKSFELNQKSWDRRTPIHIDSPFYDQIGFLEGRNTLKHIELKLLENVEGKSILPTMSLWARFHVTFKKWALK